MASHMSTALKKNLDSHKQTPMKQRPESQLRAEAAYRARSQQVLIRLSDEEADALDRVRGERSRAGYVKALIEGATNTHKP